MREEMIDAKKYTDKAELIEDKIQQIEKILMEEDITFGVAKTIIQSIEADLFRDGDAFLNKSSLKNVFPRWA